MTLAASTSQPKRSSNSCDAEKKITNLNKLQISFEQSINRFLLLHNINQINLLFKNIPPINQINLSSSKLNIYLFSFNQIKLKTIIQSNDLFSSFSFFFFSPEETGSAPCSAAATRRASRGDALTLRRFCLFGVVAAQRTRLVSIMV